MTQDPFATAFQVRPYWWEAAPPEDRGDPVPERVDVVVVGAGYAGLNAALGLVRGRRSVAVLEAGPLGIGASTRNGGLVSGGLKIAKAVERRFGGEFARAMLDEGRRSLDHLEALIRDEGLKTGYRRSGRFVGAHCRSAFAAQKVHAEALRARGVGARIVERSELRRVIGTDAYVGGLAIDDAGSIHPALYHRSLRDLVRGAGASLTPRCPVRAVVREQQGFRVLHGQGETWAKQVVVTTNGYTGELSPWFRRRLIPLASYMIATEPLTADVVARLSPEGRVFADTKRVLSYFRISPDGTRVLYGGRASFVDGSEVRGAAKLYRFMTRVWPELDGVKLTHAWKGNVAFTFDRVPHIARHDGVVYAGGCQGSGVAMATWLGHQVARSLLGANRPSAFDRESFPTVPLYNGRPWFLPAVGTWYQLRDALDVRFDRSS